MAEMTREERREAHRALMNERAFFKNEARTARIFDRADRSPHQQMKELDLRLGKGQGAARERARLYQAMMGGRATVSTADGSLSPAWLEDAQAAWKA